MHLFPSSPFRLFAFFPLLLLLNCSRGTLDPGAWKVAITHKNLGLAYLERDDYEHATREFEIVCTTVPDEPLGYANLALAYLNRNLLDQAEQAAKQAIDRADDDAAVRAILADVYTAQGKDDRAIQTLDEALEHDPSAVRVRYRFLKLGQRLRGPGQGEDEAIAQLRLIVEHAPENVAALLELGELLVKRRQFEEAARLYRRVADRLTPLPAEIQLYMDGTLSALAEARQPDAVRNAIILGNLLKVDPTYRATRDALGDPTLPSPPLDTFRTFPANAVVAGAPPLVPMRFTDVTDTIIDPTVRRAAPPAHGLKAGDAPPDADIVFVDYDRDDRLDLCVVRSDGIRLFHNMGRRFVDATRDAGLGGASQARRAVFADVDNDSLQDLYVINRNGPNGLYQNRGRKGFVLSSSRLIFRSLTPDPRPPGSGAGGVAALFADFDHDGDLDLFLASAEDHADHLYRNRADGTFEEATAQADVGRQGMDSRAAAFGDFDDDGALDLVVADGTGRHRLYRNLRQGKMADWTARFGLRGLPPADAVAAGDYNNDGFLDLVVAGAGTPSCALSWNQNGRIFVQDSTSVILARLCARLKAQSAVPLDFDNDGFLDLVVVGTSGTAASGARLLRNLGNGRFEDASSLLPPLPPSLSAVTAGDVDHDGDLDLALVTPDGTFSVLRNEGGNTHHWLDVQLAAATMGSSKNNVYGIGSTIELNAETQYQRRVVTAPVTHFGLGSRPNADVLRVFWSNGTPQNTVSPAVNQRVVEQQRLKGSCPSLYTWDGRGYTFVTHLMTRSAIGALTDTGAPAFPDAANDYVKIQGDQLRPKDGRYTLQIVEELWDAVYLDALKLLVIDHPTASNVYVDEKYLLPPFPPFRLHTATRPRRPRAAVDEHGHDVLPLLIARDERYVGDFAPTAYQGLTEPHVITLNLGDLRGATAIRLFLNGWVMPIEPSTNLALSQREGLRAMGPALQVPDARGRWQTVIPFMGFPAGENKTIVVDLTGKFLTDDFRVRITTNLQVYWNEAFFTVDEPAVAWTITPLFPQRADLHYRGFSKEYRDSPSGPYLREYAVVDPAQQWLPFEGMRTRYGSVTPLLRASDDRYAIFSSGEEITATFDATTLPPLRPGWTRDYVLYSDGWLKEGDLNTASAATIEPLPFHGMSRYPYGPDERDPNDTVHRAYLERYNTRWVSAARFRDAIRRYGDVLPRLK